jgi:hypothetical protein
LTPSDIVSFATKIEAITSSLKALPAMRHQSSMKGASSDDLNAPPLTVGLTSSTKWPYPIGPWLLRRTPKGHLHARRALADMASDDRRTFLKFGAAGQPWLL